MAKLNKIPTPHIFTHEGGPSKYIPPEKQLRRSLMACMLWEKTFYEDGEDISERIFKLSASVRSDILADMAVEARNDMKLRHAPLFLASAMAYHHRRSPLIKDTISAVIQRADELGEFCAIHARNNGLDSKSIKKCLSSQVKKGLAQALRKFDEYQLAKYNRNSGITLSDVLRLCHAKPRDKTQENLWKRLLNGELKPADTWEVSLSSGKDKKETFERLIAKKKLGYMALLRNLRGMVDAGVSSEVIRTAILERRGANRVLPFRYIAAARAAPMFERELDTALLESVSEMPTLKGETVVLVDVSISMDYKLSSKSDLKRIDAAAALASIIPAESVRVFTFSSGLKRLFSYRYPSKHEFPISVEVPPRRGISGIDVIIASQQRMGTLLGGAIREMNTLKYDRLIVITDEQTADKVPDPAGRGYMINVASYQNGVGYGKWIHIDGFSEAVIKYILAMESAE